MRFSGERRVPATQARVWAALHDDDVLRSVLPGCEELLPLGAGRYAAQLAARVGPVRDTYRGSFTVADLRPGSHLRVGVDGRGRCGHLRVELDVAVAVAGASACTLTWSADATVGGLVSRLGGAALSVAGGHFTGCFFRDLERALRHASAPRRSGQLV